MVFKYHQCIAAGPKKAARPASFSCGCAASPGTAEYEEFMKERRLEAAPAKDDAAPPTHRRWSPHIGCAAPAKGVPQQIPASQLCWSGAILYQCRIEN
jgi:hypothetical protein